jgi:hypothetical protein
MSPSRHWNVTRQITRCHAGIGKPVIDDRTRPSIDPSLQAYFDKSKSFQGDKYRKPKTANFID